LAPSWKVYREDSEQGGLVPGKSLPGTNIKKSKRIQECQQLVARLDAKNPSIKSLP
jgi:hypothetical protein